MKTKTNLLHSLLASLAFTAMLTGPLQAAPVPKTPPAASETAKVSLNKADAKSLMQINGMSAYKAHAIVSYRNKNGAFKSVNDLEQVKGFKRMKPEAIKAMGDHFVID